MIIIPQPANSPLSNAASSPGGAVAATPKGRASLPSILLVAAWGVLMVVGFVGLERYSQAPGAPGTRVEHWPNNAGLARPGNGQATVVLSVHPLCPCTAATLDELQQVLMRRDLPPFHLVVLRLLPSEKPAEWKDSALPDWLSSYPGVQVVEDRDAALSDTFGLTTSGHVAFYRPDGTLAFKGGITASRGHRGENLGAATLKALLHGQPPPAEATSVYGCSLK
ncbi:hypothetical protein DB346_02675 [Verrucomicrobia bacterium LW23]|nr:hypothetical protein DB346_03980 [Verrucomicrobia bacterium LW23]PTY04353.1 hypothetical protein DB346_02675 [Verrucomicrobia bacterium LW23]